MLVVQLLLAYLAFGIVTAIAFVAIGAPKLLAGAPSVSAWARVLLIPGAVLLWPLIVRRWLRLAHERRP